MKKPFLSPFALLMLAFLLMLAMGILIIVLGAQQPSPPHYTI